MSSLERRITILELLKVKKIIQTKELEQKLFCSTSTLRRDLLKLEEEGKIIRSHGEIQLASDNNIEYSYLSRKTEQLSSKDVIADIASTFLTHNQSIFLDSSTTSNRIIPYLRDYSNLRVITNGLDAAAQLCNMENITLYFAGGYIGYNTNSSLGDFAINFLDNFHADLAFFSCRGLDRFGTYEANHEQAHIKKHIIENSTTNLLLVDHTKFNTSHYFKLANYDRIDYVVTDKEPTTAYMDTVSNQSEILFPFSD